MNIGLYYSLYYSFDRLHNRLRNYYTEPVF